MPKDILQDANGDILLVNGDIQWGEATGQHIRDLMLSNKGDVRTSPLTGVGIADYLEDDAVNDMYHAIRTQLTRDGMKIKKLGIVAGKLVIDAHYDGEVPDYATAKNITFADTTLEGSELQSLVGLAIQEYGNVDAILQIIQDNDLRGQMNQPASIGDDEVDLGHCLNVGTTISVSDTSAYYDADTIEALKERNEKGELVKRYIYDGVERKRIYSKQYSKQYS